MSVHETEIRMEMVGSYGVLVFVEGIAGSCNMPCASTKLCRAFRLSNMRCFYAARVDCILTNSLGLTGAVNNLSVAAACRVNVCGVSQSPSEVATGLPFLSVGASST